MERWCRRPNPVFGDEYKALLRVLIEARREAGISQRVLAQRLGKCGSHVARIEAGQRRVDALELYHMAKALGRTPTELFACITESVDAVVQVSKGRTETH